MCNYTQAVWLTAFIYRKQRESRDWQQYEAPVHSAEGITSYSGINSYYFYDLFGDEVWVQPLEASYALTLFQMELWSCRFSSGAAWSRSNLDYTIPRTRQGVRQVTIAMLWRSYCNVQLSINGRGRFPFESPPTVYQTIIQFPWKKYLQSTGNLQYVQDWKYLQN